MVTDFLANWPKIGRNIFILFAGIPQRMVNISYRIVFLHRIVCRKNLVSLKIALVNYM